MPSKVSVSKRAFLTRFKKSPNDAQSLADHFDVSLATIYRFAKRYSVEFSRERPVTRDQLQTVLDSSMSDKEASQKLWLKQSQVTYLRRIYGLPPAKKPEAAPVKPRKEQAKPEIQYVTLSEYATLCGIDKTSIRDRLKSGTLKLAKLPGVTPNVRLVDLKKYPPARKR